MVGMPPTLPTSVRRRATMRESLPSEASAISATIEMTMETIATLHDDVAEDRAAIADIVARIKAGTERRDSAYREGTALFTRIERKRAQITNLRMHAYELERRLPRRAA